MKDLSLHGTVATSMWHLEDLNAHWQMILLSGQMKNCYVMFCKVIIIIPQHTLLCRYHCIVNALFRMTDPNLPTDV